MMAMYRVGEPGKMRRILFITGKFAETELHQQIQVLTKRERFVAGVLSVPVTVAALLSAKWLVRYFRKYPIPQCPAPRGKIATKDALGKDSAEKADGWTHLCVPGWCRGDLQLLEQAVGIPVVRGPRDLRELPEMFRMGHFGNQGVLGGADDSSSPTGCGLPCGSSAGSLSGTSSTDTSVGYPRVGSRRPPGAEYGAYSVKLFAKIPRASRRSVREISDLLLEYDFDRADVVVLSCDSRRSWAQLPEVCWLLRETGFQIGIDSRCEADIDTAIRCGVDFVFGVRNERRRRLLHSGILREHGILRETDTTAMNEIAVDEIAAKKTVASGTGCTLVLAPESTEISQGMEDAIRDLDAAGVNYIVDPGLSPISFGFGESLGRFLALRWKHPNVEILMNFGALVERMDGDPLGMLMVLLGFCEEQRIWSAMLSPVSDRMRRALPECDRARRMFHYALWRRVLPQHLEPDLSPLCESAYYEYTPAQLEDFAAKLNEPHYRLFVSAGELHAVAGGLHEKSRDPFLLFEILKARGKQSIDADYAFYLGYELAKAQTALALHKTYRQDEELHWGLYTRPEPTQRERRMQRLQLRRELGLDGDDPSDSLEHPASDKGASSGAAGQVISLAELSSSQRREFEEYMQRHESLRRALEDSHCREASSGRNDCVSDAQSGNTNAEMNFADNSGVESADMDGAGNCADEQTNEEFTRRNSPR